MQFFNLFGILVKEIKVTNGTQINISSLEVGVYFVRLKSFYGQSFKLVKQ